MRIKSYELHCHLALMNPNYPSQLNGTREILTTEANHFRLPVSLHLAAVESLAIDTSNGSV